MFKNSDLNLLQPFRKNAPSSSSASAGRTRDVVQDSVRSSESAPPSPAERSNPKHNRSVYRSSANANDSSKKHRTHGHERAIEEDETSRSTEAEDTEEPVNGAEPVETPSASELLWQSLHEGDFVDVRFSTQDYPSLCRIKAKVFRGTVDNSMLVVHFTFGRFDLKTDYFRQVFTNRRNVRARVQRLKGANPRLNSHQLLLSDVSDLVPLAAVHCRVSFNPDDPDYSPADERSVVAVGLRKDDKVYKFPNDPHDVKRLLS